MNTTAKLPDYIEIEYETREGGAVRAVVKDRDPETGLAIVLGWTDLDNMKQAKVWGPRHAAMILASNR